MTESPHPWPDNKQWFTADELRFLRGLGAHSRQRGLDRPALLAAYLAAMSMRRNWGKVNPLDIEDAVREMLHTPTAAVVNE